MNTRVNAKIKCTGLCNIGANCFTNAIYIWNAKNATVTITAAIVRKSIKYHLLVHVVTAVDVDAFSRYESGHVRRKKH